LAKPNVLLRTTHSIAFTGNKFESFSDIYLLGSFQPVPTILLLGY
jgi:hypothetical protein